MERKHTYKNQPYDDVLSEIKRIVEIKRMGNFEAADQEYSLLAQKEKDEPQNYPYILKSWAKIKVCLGNYDEALEMMLTASQGFRTINNQTDAWQCNDQANTIKNRNLNKNEFSEYVNAVSGGLLRSNF